MFITMQGQRKGTIGKKAMICRDGHAFTQAHYTVLQSSTLVAPYIIEHKNIVRSQQPGPPDSLITKEHMKTFGGWLRTHLMNNNNVVIPDMCSQPTAECRHMFLCIQGFRLPQVLGA